MKDYIPSGDNNLLPWADNVNNKIPEYAETLGLSDEDVKAIQTSCGSIDKSIYASTDASMAARKATKEKKTMIGESKRSLRTLLQRIKKAEGYTPAIGHDLGIIGSNNPFNPGTFKPLITGKAQPGKVLISFFKKGVDGLNIYSRNKGDATWVKLAFAGYSPYGDSRSLVVAGTAEVRQYMAIGVLKDVEIGLMSDIIEVMFAG